MCRGSCPRTITWTPLRLRTRRCKTSARVAARPKRRGRAASSPATDRRIVLKDTGQEGLLEARYRLAKFKIEIAERAFTVGDTEYPAGSWILPAQAGLGDALAEVSRATSRSISTSLASAPDVARHAAKAPRLGVWVPWADTDSIGWLRHTLDERHIPYAYVRDEDVRAGKLRDEVRRAALRPRRPRAGRADPRASRKRGARCRSRRRAQTPSHGTPASSDDITGGIGWEGLAQIQSFVESGGVLVTLGSGSMLALEGGIVRGVRRDSGGVPRSAGSGGAESAQAAVESLTRTPGSHVRVSFAQPDHPIAYGYPAHTHVFRQNYPLYAVPRHWLRMAFCTTCLDGPRRPERRRHAMGRSGRTQPFLVSGQVVGRDRI